MDTIRISTTNDNIILFGGGGGDGNGCLGFEPRVTRSRGLESLRRTSKSWWLRDITTWTDYVLTLVYN